MRNLGECVVLQLDNAKNFKDRCPEIYEAILEDACFVNWRKIGAGEEAVLALSFRA